MSERPNGLTYAQAGVDIDAGAALVERIKPLAKSTRRAGSEPSLGGFGALFDLKAAGYDDPLLVTTTDGVGTKLKLAIETGRHSTVGIDLVAMCVNDLLAQGAEPLMFLDYYATGKLDVEAAAAVVRDGQRLAEALLAPTGIYIRTVLPRLKAGRVKGLAHITGGGLVENPPRAIAEGLVPRFDWNAWTLPPVFDWLARAGGVAE